MPGGKGPSFDLEAVIPIAIARAFCQVAPDRELARLPLAYDVEVLVEYQLGIIPEILRRSPQQDPSPARGRSRTHVQARIEGMFDHSHMLDRLTEDFSERGGDVCGDGTAVA